MDKVSGEECVCCAKSFGSKLGFKLFDCLNGRPTIRAPRTLTEADNHHCLRQRFILQGKETQMVVNMPAQNSVASNEKKRTSQSSQAKPLVELMLH